MMQYFKRKIIPFWEIQRLIKSNVLVNINMVFRGPANIIEFSFLIFNGWCRDYLAIPRMSGSKII